MASASDNFNRADEVLVNPPWVSQNGFPPQILGNDITANAVATQSPVYWSTVTTVFTANHYSQIRFIAGVAGSAYVYALCRASSSDPTSNRYILRSDGTTTTIRKLVSGTESELVNCGVGMASGDIMRLQVLGNVITAFKNGSQIGQIVDNDLASGQPGCSVFDTASAADDWEAADVSVGTPFFTVIGAKRI